MFYVVEKGDTLYGISRQYGISVDELMRANNLDSTNLVVGSKLIIPRDDLIEYKVVKGDTLYSISRKYNVSVNLIKQFNNLNSNTINVGSILYIPSNDNNNDNVGSDDNNSNYYIVKSGDTLWSIAKRFGVSVDSLIQNNGLTNSTLSIGQKLIINKDNNTINIGMSCYGEGGEINYITHVVVKGDNLYNIAKKYGVSVQSIMKLNNLSNDNLSIGQVLKIKEVL